MKAGYGSTRSQLPLGLRVRSGEGGCVSWEDVERYGGEADEASLWTLLPLLLSIIIYSASSQYISLFIKKDNII